MDANDLAARVKRLDALARGLAKELAAVQGETLTVLLYRERRGYLEALHQAMGGVEGARVTLARALRRLEGCGRPATAGRQSMPASRSICSVRFECRAWG